MILVDPIIYYNNNENEVWKPLLSKGIRSGEYLISNFGNIYDLVKHEYVPQSTISSGYNAVYLRKDGTVLHPESLVHRLVADNFVGPKREDQIQVNHINGIKTCNRDINLEWNSPKENTKHAFETGLAINNIGERSHLAKLTDSQVETICQLLSEGKRYFEILNIIGLENNANNRDMIGNIYRRIAWTQISNKYEFPDYDDRFRVNSKETIKYICKAIEDGLDNKAVYEKVFNKPLKSSRDDKQNYELIRLIRNKKSFTDISEKYNF